MAFSSALFSPLSLHFPLFLFSISLAGTSFYLSFLQDPSKYFFSFFYFTCRIRTLSSSSDKQAILYIIVLRVLVADKG